MSLKDYQLKGKIGQGSFGIVFKAFRKKDNYQCVIKEVALDKMDKRSKNLALNQAKVLKGVDSQWVVKYLDSFFEKQKLYIIMEYCTGGDLAQYLKGQMGKPLSQQLVWKLSLQILIGLRDLHACKILHRDIKTMNIFLGQGGKVKIGDLGVARTLNTDFASTVVGTPYYLSPQMCEQKPYNEKTDVWAVGCVIYQLCTFKHPFQANSHAALALKIVTGKYSPVPTFYSNSLSRLIKLCLSVDHKRRPTVQFLLNQPQVLQIVTKYKLQLPLNSLQTNRIKQNEQKNKTNEKKILNVQGKSNSLSKNQKQIQIKKDFKNDGKIQKNISKNRGSSKQAKQSKQIINNKPIVPAPSKITIPPPVKQKKVIPSFQNEQNNKKLNNFKIQNKIGLKIQKQQIKIIKQQNIKNNKQQKKDVKIQIIPQKKEQKLKKIQQQQKDLFGRKKSVQQVVEDYELLADFGITPQKLNVMQQKVQFKKVKNIKWDNNNMQQIENEQMKKNEQNKYKQLPTIKPKTINQTDQMQIKQIQDQQPLAQQMSDDAPYKSQSSQQLLIQSIGQNTQFNKQQKLINIQKKLAENQKRKKQLTLLCKQHEDQLLKRLKIQQLQRIKQIVFKQQDGIDMIIKKQLKSNKQVQSLYKIFFAQQQMKICQQNISACLKVIKQYQI